jgi:hypothetical protein
MNSDEAADHTQDPCGTDTGTGYPEEQQGGAQPGVGRDEDDERQGGQDDAPSQSGSQDGDPGQATGNRNAAG